MGEPRSLQTSRRDVGREDGILEVVVGKGLAGVLAGLCKAQTCAASQSSRTQHLVFYILVSWWLTLQPYLGIC